MVKTMARTMVVEAMVVEAMVEAKDDGKDDGTKTTTKYTLTVSSPTCGTVTNGDSTINCGSGGSDCSAQFDKDKSVTLTAAAASSGYTIGDWGGDCSGSGDCTLSIDANKTVTKAFTLPAGASDSDNDCTSDTTDVDDDNDGLIEIHDLDMFNNIRHNLNGTSYKTGSAAPDDQTGAPTKATDDCDTATDNVYLCGYELMRDLDFAQGASYASNTINDNWRPFDIGDNPVTDDPPDTAVNAGFPSIDGNFAGIFEGNENSISHLYSRNTTSSTANIGLFARTTTAATIRNLGVADANLYGGTGVDTVGALVGRNDGNITASFATGGTVNGDDGVDTVGGLVGFNEGGNITASYATGAVNGGTGGNDTVGSLVGTNHETITTSYATGDANGGDGSQKHVGGLVGTNIHTITASYATGDANGGDGDDDEVGGLVGWNNNGGRIIASYAAGNADGGAGNDSVGGLVGYNDNAGVVDSSIIASYATGGEANGGAGNDSVGGLVGQNDGSVIASYTTDDAIGGRGNDNIGSLAGLSNGRDSASYGFGSTARAGGGGTVNNIGDPGALTVNGLTAMNAGPEWNDDSEDTLNAWDFGTASQPPALKYADYDGAGTDFSCDMFPATILGTNTALTCNDTLLPGQR